MIAGIDFSVHAVDTVLLNEDDNTAAWHRRQLGKGDAFDKARRVRDLMPARAEWLDSGVIAIALERPFSRNYGTVAALMRIQGAILSCLPASMLVVEFAPTRWKQVSVGKSNASKDEVAEWARDCLADAGSAWLGWRQDALDAYAIAWAARSLLERSEVAA